MAKDNESKETKREKRKLFIWGLVIGIILAAIFGNPIVMLIEYIIEHF
ncbi:M48 family metallopeptidase [Jeotgalicoccus huakuii]|nr:M48 family metallopeptidase [Jeotgalicoccus huakuii]